MIELFLNEFLSTFPFHILACVPFHKRLRHSPWKTFLWVCGFELGYLLLFMFLIQVYIAVFSIIQYQQSLPPAVSFHTHDNIKRSESDNHIFYQSLIFLY